jgi:hypothetical protein
MKHFLAIVLILSVVAGVARAQQPQRAQGVQGISKSRSHSRPTVRPGPGTAALRVQEASPPCSVALTPAVLGSRRLAGTWKYS